MFSLLNRLVLPLLGLLFGAAILTFASSYTVRFTETAVLTTFGAAGEGSVKEDAGFYWKWPYPFQSVTKYDTRIRVVQTRSESQQTADDFQIVAEAYMTYRVDDPLAFFRSFSSAGTRPVDHFRKAEQDVLRDRLRSTMGEISAYRMDQLFTPVVGGSSLPELEARILELMRSGGDSGRSLSEYGIEVVSVGIDRLILPEETTSAVMERMGANRDRLAQRFESEGEAIATAITAKARSDAEKIRAFARRRAAEIEARGYREAAPFLEQQAEDPDFAVFLANIELLRDATAKRFTLVLSADDYGLGLFSPDALSNLRPGELPTFSPAADEGINR